jgi:sugar phosphate isomerase/epimerase
VTRRECLALAAAALPSRARAGPSRPPLCLFSKHLPKLNYADLARTVKQIGFDGVDLTVRPGGHVLPERAAEDMPRAIDAIHAESLSVPMITTGLLNAKDSAARPTLSTAARLGVGLFKPGYWQYRAADNVETRIAEVRADAAGLVALAKEYGIAAGFHNHSGEYVGEAVWDARAIIGDMDPRWIGYYFDPCHATAEGGLGGWSIALRMVLPRLKMVALKDFYWEKAGAKWNMKMCPLGEGMVDWIRVFSMLAAGRFTGPLSLHVEYDPADMPAAIARDYAFAKKQIEAAYQG